jgi:isopentenyldiphosphate isomerase
MPDEEEEHFDILDEAGNRTGVRRPRSEVHALGLLHRAVHVWIFCAETGEVVLQRRAACKDSWPDRWDISSAGHVSAGDESLDSAVRELEEELGVVFPRSRFAFLFTHLERLDSVQKGKPFLNHEFNDVYLVTVSAEERAALPAEAAVLRDVTHASLRRGGGAGEGTGADVDVIAPANTCWILQRSEVSAVCWKPWREVRRMYESGDPELVPSSDISGSYGRLFLALEEGEEARGKGGNGEEERWPVAPV